MENTLFSTLSGILVHSKPKLIFCLLICFSQLNLFAQISQQDTGFVKHAAAVLHDQFDKQPVEKVYLHLDKPYYMAGEDIWFKAYLTAGDLHQLSTISGVLNVELVSEADQQHPVQALKLAVTYGRSIGDFHLSDALPAGQYHIRAYTNYMRNAGSAYFFDQPILIGNAVTNKATDMRLPTASNVKAKQQKEASATTGADVQFFPEGGGLVNGISSVVAFKATGADGMGKAVTGIVADNDGVEITRFSSSHLGMGSFNLYPMAGKTYKAVVTFADGSHQTVSLPAVANAGYVLSVYNRPASPNVAFRVSLNNSDHSLKPADSTLVLIARSGAYVCYATKILMRGSIISGGVPKEKFPTGIAQFTLFKANGEPLCERIAFINNHDQLTIELTDSNRVNLTRQKTKINLHVKDADGKPVIGSFSVAVINNDIVPDKTSERSNILNYLLLTSDLKGYIEAPGYYFNKEDDTTQAGLDLLMLTQGYRRFEWKQALANSTPAIAYLPELGFSVSGRLITPDGKPVARGKITLLNKSNNFLLDTLSDSEGTFTFHNIVFLDSLRFLLQAKAADGSDNVRIQVEDAKLPVYEAFNSSIRDTTTFPEAYLKNGKQQSTPGNDNGIVLQEVKVKAAMQHNTRGASSYSANLNGAGVADQILTSKDLENQGGDLSVILMGKLTNIRVINGALVSSRSASLRGGRAMLIIFDGNYFYGNLSDINPSDVESIEVLKSAGNTAPYGSRGGNGVVIITTKHGGDDAPQKSLNAAIVVVPGFYKARVFYSPQYNNPKVNVSLPDRRSTIYWNPDIITNKEGDAAFSFFNAAEKGTYRVVIEGIGINGKVGHQLFYYKAE